MTIGRIIAGLAAANSAVAIVWRFFLNLADKAPLDAIWSLYGYFTIFSNTAVALSGAALVLAPHRWLARPAVRHAVAAAMLGVGIVYSVALRHLEHFTGAGAIVNHMFHDVAPPLFLLAWLAAPHGALKPWSVATALVFPGTYLLYVLIRGAATGWYPYWFLNPVELGLGSFAVAVLAICAAFAILAAILLGIDRLLGRRNS